MNRVFISVFLVTVALTGCASNSKVVPRGQAYKTVSFGAVIAKEEVTIGGTHTGIGSYVGSAAAIHDSTSNSFLGLVLRGLAGAIIGSATEEALTRRPGMLYTIETTRGGLIEVVSTNMEISNGDCVQIAHAGMRHTDIEPTNARNCYKPATQTTSV